MGQSGTHHVECQSFTAGSSSRTIPIACTVPAETINPNNGRPFSDLTDLPALLKSPASQQKKAFADSLSVAGLCAKTDDAAAEATASAALTASSARQQLADLGDILQEKRAAMERERFAAKVARAKSMREQVTEEAIFAEGRQETLEKMTAAACGPQLALLEHIHWNSGQQCKISCGDMVELPRTPRSARHLNGKLRI